MAAPGWQQQQQQQLYAQQAYAQQMQMQQMQHMQQVQQYQMYGQAQPLAYQQPVVPALAGWPQAAHPQLQPQRSQQEHDPIMELRGQLGIEADEEQALGWIADVALDTPLPSNWECNQDPSTGRIYFVDTDTQTSVWENPLLPHLRKIVEIGRTYRDSPWPPDSYFEDARMRLWEEQKEELLKWHGPFTNAQGREYYVNSGSAQTMFSDPRTEAQHVCELLQSFLGTLEDELTRDPEPPMPQEDSPKAGDFWTSTNGAEVLTLEPHEPPPNPGNVTPRLFALQQKVNVDHRSTLQKMTEAADWLQTACQEEEEVQKLRLAKMAELRKQRRLKKQRSDLHKSQSLSLTGMDLSKEPVKLDAVAAN